MRTNTRFVPVLATLAVLAACSDPIRPAVGRQVAGSARAGIGIYVGSGTSVADTVLVSSTGEAAQGNRGSGYIGGGH